MQPSEMVEADIRSNVESAMAEAVEAIMRMTQIHLVNSPLS